MFTGIIEEQGAIISVVEGADSAVLRVRGPLVTSDAQLGDSISVNGVCLTVVTLEDDEFTCDVMAESLQRTSLGSLGDGSRVNLERAMAANGRFGGHVVQGHVDGTAQLLTREPGDRWEVLTFELPADLAKFVVEKGSITIDGVSLTVSAVTAETFSVSLIPTTLEITTLGTLAVGARVNVEVDVVAKYLANLGQMAQLTPLPSPEGMAAKPGFASIDAALEALRTGRPVLVLDDIDRENEGDIIVAAETLTDEWLAWTIRHSSGYLCAPMPAEFADRLQLPPMVANNEDSLRTAYTVTVDAKVGITTGISAADRARTIRLLADPATTADDLIRPGHVVPLRARDGGVFVRPGHTEAAVDLCRLAGLSPVAAIGELVHDDGSMMRTDAVLELGARHWLPVITIADLIAWRREHDRVVRVASTTLPTQSGTFTAHGYRDLISGAEHVALVSERGFVGDAPLARIHSECLTGDAFGSLRCDCGPQLRTAMATVANEGGAVVYLRGHEGRGVGLLSKLAAYALQDQGRDTVDAQTDLGLPVDAREYGAGAAILRDLGQTRITLMSNNPAKVEGLASHGIDVAERRPVVIEPNAVNEFYLETKRDKMGHLLPQEG